MYKYILLILAFSSVILAVERPDWYPENAAEIEAKCREEYPISVEDMAELGKLVVVDTPAMRSLMFCGATRKNVYRPGVGFEPERFVAGLKYATKIDCKLDSVRECAEKHKELQPEELMFGTTVKCVFDNAEENCKRD